jgi:pyridoxal phosphate enzyme (YggS family)
MSHPDLIAQYQAVKSRIQSAELKAHREGQTHLLAVSKTRPAQAVACLAQAGQVHFGENYVQEGVEKIQALQADWPHLQWHMIGPIQSNKTKLIAEHFDWVHTLDRLKIAQRLNDQRPAGLAPLKVLIQLNLDDEASKSGLAWADTSGLVELAKAILALPNLQLMGLMVIPAPQGDPDKQQAAFGLVAARLAWLKAQLGQAHSLCELSMGMSADLESAVEMGATWVRIGTDIFGLRDRPHPLRSAP